MPDIPSIEDVLIKVARENVDTKGTIALLQEREDLICDGLRAAGMQFGLFPAIVAEVLMEVELGTPPSAEQRTLIHNQFHLQMEELRRMMEGGQG